VAKRTQPFPAVPWVVSSHVAYLIHPARKPISRSRFARSFTTVSKLTTSGSPPHPSARLE